jgi:hypothetical protein
LPSQETKRLDVICEAVHFPAHIGPHSLPSYITDWSHLPYTVPLGRNFGFSAALDTDAKCELLDERLNKVEIFAIHIDTVRKNGVAVGSSCTSADYLMAFLHWRAILLKWIDQKKQVEGQANIVGEELEQEFCQTMSLGQIPKEYESGFKWLLTCYHVFAVTLREQLPHLTLDRELEDYIDAETGLNPQSRRKFLQRNFGDRMMGRCFCITEGGRMCMGSRSMTQGDIIVIPLGCRTPIILRKEGNHGD